MKTEGCSIHWSSFIMVVFLCALYQGLHGKAGGEGRGGEKKDGRRFTKERGKMIPIFRGFMTSTEEVKYTQNLLSQR